MERISLAQLSSREARFNCEEVKRLSDAYVDGELLPEEDTEVLRHVRICRECARFIESANRLKGILRASVKSVAAPPALFRNVLSVIRT
jgi:anti-sigma factor RsiW